MKVRGYIPVSRYKERTTRATMKANKDIKKRVHMVHCGLKRWLLQLLTLSGYIE